MHLRPLGNKKEKYVSHRTRYIEYWASYKYSLAIFQQGFGLNYSTISSPEEERISSSVWRDLGLITQGKLNGWLYMTIRKKEKKVNTENETYRIAADLVYSLLGSISRPFSSTFLTKSKVDKTDAAASVRVEWARCFPGQILPERRWLGHEKRHGLIN